MLKFKDKSKKDTDNIKEFLRLSTDKKLFKNREKYYFHIYNILYPIAGKKITDNTLLKWSELGEEDTINKIIKNFDPEKCSLVQERMFDKCLVEIEDIDLIFVHGNTRRIKIEELKFVLRSITNKIYNNTKNDKETKLAYNYFLNTFKESFNKKFGRSLDRNKLSHILNVLEKYKLIHRVPDKARKVVEYKVGSKNPFYLFSLFPDIEEEKEIELPLNKQNRILKIKNNQLEGENEKLKEKNKSLIIEKNIVKRNVYYDVCFN